MTKKKRYRTDDQVPYAAENLNLYFFPRRLLEIVFFGSIVNIKNEYLFSRYIGVNLSAEQANRPKNANWDVKQKISKNGDTFIPNEPRKRHLSFIKADLNKVCGKEVTSHMQQYVDSQTVIKLDKNHVQIISF